LPDCAGTAAAFRVLVFGKSATGYSLASNAVAGGGKRAAAQRWWRRSLSSAEKQGQRYDLGLTHLEMGRRLGERAHLERAEAILGDVGAQLDLARARDLLARESERL